MNDQRKGGETTPRTITEEQIAARAYEIFVRRGCMHGMDKEDWLVAEAELRAEVKGVRVPETSKSVPATSEQNRQRPTTSSRPAKSR